MDRFNQHAGTRRNYEFALGSPTGEHPVKGRPTWHVTQQLNADGVPSTVPLARLEVTTDGLRATVFAGGLPGRVTVGVSAEVPGDRKTLHAQFEVTILPVVEHPLHAIRPTFAQLGSAPL